MPKTALVTGASTGIGRDLCNLLARDGYALWIVARDAAKLDQVAAELRQAGSPLVTPQVTCIPADLAVAGAAQRIVDALGSSPDVLINNAGFGSGGAFGASDFASELGMIQVNVTALVELTHLLLPGMLARRSGRILNIASTAAFQPGPLMATYYATKAFVLSFSEAIAEEVRGSGVTVTVLCPGPTATEFQKRAKMENSKLFKGGLKVMGSAEVAGIGYRAMQQGKTLSVAGWRNRLGMEALRLAPRSIVRRMVHRLNSSTY